MHSFAWFGLKSVAGTAFKKASRRQPIPPLADDEGGDDGRVFAYRLSNASLQMLGEFVNAVGAGDAGQVSQIGVGDALLLAGKGPKHGIYPCLPMGLLGGE